ncbi:hypothetical protein EYF80_006601 [Liparis tanakae]|uniref:Uncharacterized protein n=1 Tax=Liparis tanakae TaxID=230148 RepID=A0A4Z2IZL1_9TELE|nr:hypothetical protein EYF80_006601 [Liparis tanakae]
MSCCWFTCALLLLGLSATRGAARDGGAPVDFGAESESGSGTQTDPSPSSTKTVFSHLRRGVRRLADRRHAHVHIERKCEPNSSKSERVLQLGAMQPGAMQPGAMQPGAMQPGAMQLGAMQLGAMQPT